MCVSHRDRKYGPSPRTLPYLLANQRHDADAGEDVLPGQPFSGDAVGEGLGAVGSGLTEVTHEERDVRPERTQQVRRQSDEGRRQADVRLLLELLLRFPPQVSDQPLRGEGVLGGHPIAHHGVQEGLPLPRVEAQHLEHRR